MSVSRQGSVDSTQCCAVWSQCEQSWLVRGRIESSRKIDATWLADPGTRLIGVPQNKTSRTGCSDFVEHDFLALVFPARWNVSHEKIKAASAAPDCLSASSACES